MTTSALSRRDFLKATGSLVVAFNFFDPLSLLGQGLQGGTPLSNSGGLSPDQLDSWIAISPDGIVSVFTSKVDLGTGTGTALGQIVAEELDVAVTKINMEIGDTTKCVDQGRTSASRTLERGGPQLRQAAAAARQELLKRASAQLNAPASQLTVADGIVSVAGSPARNVSYAALVGGKKFDTTIAAKGEQWDLDVAANVKPKDPKDYKVVGTPVARFDLPPKFLAKFEYSHEVRLPGMLHGRVVRPPVVNSKPVSVDDASVRNIPGMVKVVQQGNFVGVVAETEWAAIRAARALKVTWSAPPTKFPAGPEAMYDYLRDSTPIAERVAPNPGNVAAAYSSAAKTFDATYRWPFQMHGMIGPSCAVADVQGDTATIYSGSQAPFITRNGVARLIGLKDENVHFVYKEGAGCFGRLEPDDAPEDAALMSKAVGRPVRVQWMREDEHGWEPKGPPQLITIKSGVDAQGHVTSWEYTEHTIPWTDARLTPMLASRQTGIKPDENGIALGGGDTAPYLFTTRKSTAATIGWMMNPNPLRTANLRAPYSQARCFAAEAQMDDMAAAAGVDPIEFRLRYLSDRNTPRVADVLRAVAKQANWVPKSAAALVRSANSKIVSGRGVAVSGMAGTVCAQIADVEVDRTTGKITVKTIAVAHDCGIIVNPDGLKNQIEGNVIQGSSRALLEEVDFDAAGVKNLNWNTYPIIRFRDVPDVDIVLIDRREMPPLGAGEASQTGTAAAIGNAVFDATGVRLRQVPLTPTRLLAALRGKA